MLDHETKCDGKGMGMGDLKLMFSLGFVFGWPDIALVIAIAFVVGALFGGILLLGKLNLKSAIPFGPFIVVGSLLVFFFGSDMARYSFGV